MSFGWSAGDIAAAIKLTVRVYEALDSCCGAAKEYREATSFLKELTHTLEPLKSFVALGAYPVYGKEISDRVAFIKEPVENLLQEIVALEPNLGVGSKSGHGRNVLPKLRWHFRISKRVLSLQTEIRSHLRILDILLQRLTLDIISRMQLTLPDAFLAIFHQRIQPDLIKTLREILDTGQTQPTCSCRITPEVYAELLSQLEELKEHITTSSRDVQVQFERVLRSAGPSSTRNPSRLTGSPITPTAVDPDINPRQALTYQTSTGRTLNEVAGIDQDMARESLSEVYYLVLLYLGTFLKNLFLLLSRYTRPSRQLAPTLLASLNITFLDPLGRPPRILPFEFFRNFQVFRAFLREEFRALPIVRRGQYLLMDNQHNHPLHQSNWHCHAFPGSVISMAALMASRVHFKAASRCPDPACSGSWSAPASKTWLKCPVCDKEVFSSAHRLVDPGCGDAERNALEDRQSGLSVSASTMNGAEGNYIFRRIMWLTARPEPVPEQYYHEDEEYAIPFYRARFDRRSRERSALEDYIRPYDP